MPAGLNTAHRTTAGVLAALDVRRGEQVQAAVVVEPLHWTCTTMQLEPAPRRESRSRR
jgi:hypothetical protein